MFCGWSTASITPVVEGMPVLKNTANTTSDALPHNSSMTNSTNTNMAMLRMCRSQHIRDAPSWGDSPRSLWRLTSYRPMARKGPTNRQPDTSVRVYSGWCLKTRPSNWAISQKHRP